jgi:hypothetical protein
MAAGDLIKDCRNKEQTNNNKTNKQLFLWFISISECYLWKKENKKKFICHNSGVDSLNKRCGSK